MLAFITTFSCVSSFLFGWDLGLMGGALLHIKDEFGTGDSVLEVIVGAAKLGAVLGTFLGGGLMLYYGRRPAIALDSLFFLVGPIIMATAWNVAGLIVGRVIVGIGIGVSAVVVPSYLGEVAPAKARGRVVALYEVMLCLGMLAATLADAALDDVPGNWRWMVGAPAFPAAFMSLAVFLIPESPRWLVVRGRLDEALAVIHRVHTAQMLPVGMQTSIPEVEAELMELWSSVEKDKNEAARRQAAYQANRQRRRQQAGKGRGDGQARQSSVEGNTELVRLTPAGVGDSAAGWGEGDGNGGDLSPYESMEVEEAIIGIPPRLPRIRTNPSELKSLVEGSDSGGKNENALESVAAPGAAEPAGEERRAGTVPSEDPQEQQRQQLEDEVEEQQPGLTAAPLLKPDMGFWATTAHMLQDIWAVSQGPERAAFRMVIILAVFNQAFASTAILNYAPAVLQRAGLESTAAAALFTSAVSGSKLVGVLIAFFLVDSLGRRPLLLWGSAGCAAALAALVPADWANSQVLLVTGMCLFILFFSMSWAGVFWVLLSEVFSMGAKSPAASAATACLFFTGAVVDLIFLTMHSILGPFVFLACAVVACAAAVYVCLAVPETKGRTLQEVQTMLERRPHDAEAAAQWDRTHTGALS